VLLAFIVGRGGKKSSTAHDHSRESHAESGKVTETVWTCSMHPQIQLPRKGQCPICFMDLIPLESGGGADDDAPVLTMSEYAKTIAGIQTTPVIRQDVSKRIYLNGKIQADETRVKVVSSRIAGRIDRLYVDYTGILVKNGDHLAQIYSPELLTLQKELIEAKAALDRTDSTVSKLVRNSLRNTYDAAREKLRLLGFTGFEIERILQRQKTSDHMTIRADNRGIVLEKMVLEGAYVRAGTPLFRIADLRKLWLILDAYESDIPWIRLGQEVIFMVKAWPGVEFTGTVSFISPVVDPASRTVQVRVITDNGQLRLKPEMLVRATINVDVGSGGAVISNALKGKWISPMHPQIVKDKPGNCDICGMPLVKAEELGYVTSGGGDDRPLVIPVSAPLITGKRAVVYVEKDGGEGPAFEGRNVVLGPRVGDSYIVSSGLSEGERVVENGAFKIDGELQIRARPSMMNPALESEPEAPVVMRKKAEPAFLSSLNEIYEAYFKVAKALAKDNTDTAKDAFSRLDALVERVSASQKVLYDPWRNSKRKLKTDLKKIGSAETIDELRIVFENVSDQMVALQKHYGHGGEEDHFLAYCPMAFNDKGAYWLQTNDTILNPYFGASMLRCGVVKETFKGD